VSFPKFATNLDHVDLVRAHILPVLGKEPPVRHHQLILFCPSAHDRSLSSLPALANQEMVTDPV
jgi:hypothetical protein